MALVLRLSIEYGSQSTWTHNNNKQTKWEKKYTFLSQNRCRGASVFTHLLNAIQFNARKEAEKREIFSKKHKWQMPDDTSHSSTDDESERTRNIEDETMSAHKLCFWAHELNCIVTTTKNIVYILWPNCINILPKRKTTSFICVVCKNSTTGHQKCLCRIELMYVNSEYVFLHFISL